MFLAIVIAFVVAVYVALVLPGRLVARYHRKNAPSSTPLPRWGYILIGYLTFTVAFGGITSFAASRVAPNQSETTLLESNTGCWITIFAENDNKRQLKRVVAVLTQEGIDRAQLVDRSDLTQPKVDAAYVVLSVYSDRRVASAAKRWSQRDLREANLSGVDTSIREPVREGPPDLCSKRH